MERLNFSELAMEIIAEFKSSFAERGKALDAHIENDLWGAANPVIAEVFRNYLSNALKYAPDDQPVVVDLIREDRNIGFYVRDLGTSIQGQDREAIFQRSVQLANGKSRGSGLGLAIVKRIADVHEAEVGVVPNDPTGNVFYMKFPVFQTDRDEQKEIEGA